MRRVLVFVLSLGMFAAVAACVPGPPSVGNCSAPAAPGVDWHNCDKTGAELAVADLSGANLSGANLSGANPRNLRGANLRGANLSNADLQDADLTGADLSGANLTDVFGVDVVLTNAILKGANLTDAFVVLARIGNVDLTGANLTRASLGGASGLPSSVSGILYDHTTCPDGTNDGSGWEPQIVTSPETCVFVA